MKYVYAILTVVGNNPIMKTIQSPSQLTGRQVLEKVVMTPEERVRYKNVQDENEILRDMNLTQPIRVEIQEVEVR